MRITWPELVALIALAILLVIAGNFMVMDIIVHASGGSKSIVVPVFFALMILDLWGILRLVDWAFAGPARRKGLRVL
jgi:ABC-type sugar transport system permease subunit